jgi:hypothetical protein
MEETLRVKYTFSVIVASFAIIKLLRYEYISERVVDFYNVHLHVFIVLLVGIRRDEGDEALNQLY